MAIQAGHDALYTEPDGPTLAPHDPRRRAARHVRLQRPADLNHCVTHQFGHSAMRHRARRAPRPSSRLARTPGKRTASPFAVVSIIGICRPFRKMRNGESGRNPLGKNLPNRAWRSAVFCSGTISFCARTCSDISVDMTNCSIPQDVLRVVSSLQQLSIHLSRNEPPPDEERFARRRPGSRESPLRIRSTRDILGTAAYTTPYTGIRTAESRRTRSSAGLPNHGCVQRREAGNGRIMSELAASAAFPRPFGMVPPQHPTIKGNPSKAGHG